MAGARKRIGLLFGGRSAEHDVSRLSAADILRALDPDRYEIIPIAITRDEAHDPVGADHLLPSMQADTLIADKAFDADERVIKPLVAADSNGRCRCLPHGGATSAQSRR